MARLNANGAAIEVVQALRAESRAATPAEQEILAGWSGWGAVSAVFEEKPGEDRAFTQARQQLRALLTDKEYAAARRNTVNAHYTGTALARAMWDGLAALGFSGGRVLEPGCGSGNFIGLAPLGTAMAGIELDPVTAHVAAALYPHAQIRNESFADTQLPEGSFDAAIGNVPFGKIHLNDSRYNPGRRHPIHTHFVLKSAALVRPGGWIALITSRYTLDGTGKDAVAARRQLAELGELAAAIRLPAAAHRRTAGTDVVTDVLVFRRFGDGEQLPPGEPAWIQTVPVDVGGVQIPVNRYFADNPGMVLGELAAGGARRADDLQVIAPVGTDVAASLAQALAGGRVAPAPRSAAPAPAVDRLPEGYQQARPDGTFARITSKFFEPFDPPGRPAGQAELRALLGMRDAAMALLDAELATTEDSGVVDDLRADLNGRYDAYVADWGPVNRYTRQVKIRDTPEGRALRDQLLAEGDARFTGGKLEISDPAVRDQLVAAGHATVTGTGELRFGRTREARAERQRLLDSGQARARGGTLTLTETGRARVLENAADLHDAVTIIRARPSQGGFRNDPFAVRVLALEKYDPETGIARKNDIMRHRVLLPRPAVERAEDPEDALAICMDRYARVRLDVIAALLGAASEQDARDRLDTLVYNDPAEGRLVPAQEYLSGDVRVKLHQAAAAAADDPACQANVEALTKVIPPDLGPAEIEARLGAVFITPAEVQQFLRETLADASVTVALAANGTWSVRGGDRHSVAATITWGTADRDALSLAEHLLNRKGPVEVTRKDAEGRTWTDEEATAAAREKQAELSDRFAGWAWEDLDRAGEICRRYNDAFNSIVLRSYDEVQLSLPGVNRDISLFWWQKAAIARMIYEPTAGLFHDMGAGKTLEQIIGVMEQKRLGLIRKPVICVKNHLLDQFRDEFLWAYPQARILCADTSDLEGEERRRFIARCAAENPDAIIMTRGAFESIPLTPEGHEAYLDYMKQMFAVHAEAVTESVKDEETLLAEFEEKLRAYFDPDFQKDEDQDQGQDEPDRKRRKRKVEQDPAMCWEQMGIDYVCVDESQDFNNLWVPSDEPGMAIGFTHRAIDLEMKLHAIRRRYGSRAGALATGTPVTNKIAQFYVLQRYLRPERLQAAGFAGYAPWAATYTEPEQRLEMKADGRFGMVTRMRLINFPELLLDLHYFGDFKDADDIGLPRPAIRGGRPEIRGNPAVMELVDYQSTLPERYRKAKGGKKHKGDDTVVAVIGDGFRAAQDLRLVKANHGEKPSLTDEPQKIDHIADDVYAEWLAHRDDVYPGEDGQPDPVTGSLQLVFCNEGVPSNDWNLYDELRNLLIERGMPRAAVRFIHAATDARKKATLFAACNVGHVAVLIGSTEKMGVGTNVQRRVIGVHHVHPHWRPDYDAQEDARARRPGNLNTEVFIKKWITEGSFDTIRAQACERKSVFLRVIKHRDTSVRSIEAPGDDTVSYAEIAAVGAGEPRLIQKAQLESELQQLARAQRRHVNNQNALKVAEQQARASITAAEQAIRDIDAAAGRVVPTAGDAFSMTVDGTAFTVRREAGDHLISCLRNARARVPAGECHTTAIGTIGGFQLAADLAHDGREDTIVVLLAELPGGVVRLDHRKLPAGIGLVTRLENRLAGLDKLRLEQQAILDRQRQEITRAQSAIGTPFPQQDALLATKKALDTLVTELRGDKNGKDGAKAGPATTAAASAGTRHDDNRDIRPAAGTRPAHVGGLAATNTTQVPGRAGVADSSASAKPAAAAPGTSHGTGTDWTSGHPFSVGIATLRQAALADSTLIQQARTNDPGRFLQAFRTWADDHAASTDTSPDSPLPPFAVAYFDDPVFAADMTAALAARLHQSLAGTGAAGDPGPDPDATAEAARAVKASIERTLRDACSCSSGCDRCRLPGDRDPDLAEAVRISIRLSRAGMPRQQRVITWDQPSASYVIEYAVPDGGTYRLTIPPEGKQIRISNPDGSAMVTSMTRGDPDATEWAAAAYAEATGHQSGANLAHRTGTPATSAGPGAEGAARDGIVTQQTVVSASGPPAEQAPASPAQARPDSATGRSGSASGDGAPYGEEPAAPAARQPGTADASMPASGLSGLAARDTGLGRDVGAALAEHAVAKSTVPAPERPANQDQAAAIEPADDPAASLVIEHRQQGTLVHGTEKNDQELRRLLRKQGFRWSGNLNAWYLPRPWTFSTRNQRVTGLTASLRQAHRSFTMRSQPSAPGAADDPPPEPVPSGEPYTDLRQAQDDHSAAVYDYWELTRTPAGNNVMSARQPGARPDAAALDAAYHAVHVSWQQAFAGDPHEVAARFTAWMQAASTLSRHLAAEQHRAPKFRQTLDTFIRSATRLASRTQATAEDPAAWARVFAGIPGNAPDTNPHPEAITPDPAQPTASSPEPGAAPARNQQGGQDSDEPGHTTAPAADDDTAAPSPARPADAAPALPAACRSAADLRQLAAACGLSIDTESAGALGTQLTVIHDDGRTVLLHDDISGTSAGGYRLDPGEVPAYLAAYARHPQLPPRCLADLVRQDPAAPGSLTLAGAREIAARHDLEIRIRRAREQAYITFCEPDTVGPPTLSYPAGTGSACHGPCTVPVAAINGYLLTYRDSVPAAMFTAPAAAPQDWARRVAQLTPHLVDGGGYFIRDTRDHLRAALTAARDGNTDEASRLLGQAETVTPPLTPTPERQAELLAVIGEHAARYGYADDPAGCMARAMPPLLDASDREWDWVRTYIADHPDVRERTGRDGPVADAGQRDDGRQAAAGKSRQAKTALENGDYEQALALLDEAELLYPDHGISWEAARDQVRGAMRQATSPRPQDQDSLRAGVQAPAGSVAEAPATSAARPSAPASPANGMSGDAGTAAAPDVAGAMQPQRRGRYSSRIRIGTATGTTTVSGTSDLDDPLELREALLANGFTWREQRGAWVYAGGNIGPLEAVAAIRDLLARLDHGQDSQPAAAPRSSAAPEIGTAASAVQPADGDEIPAHGAAVGSPQQSPRPGRADDAPAADKVKAGEVMAAARSAPGQGAGVTGADPGTAAPSPPSGEPPPAPVTNSDLARALHHLHGWEFAQFISQVQEPGRAGSRTGRQDGNPGAGARESLDWDASNLRITISGPGIRRYSQLSWPQIEHWIDAGMTPARLGLIVTASQLRSFCQSHRQELIAAGRCDPDAAGSELAQIRDDAISTVIAAALRTRGAAAPVPPARPGTPAYHTAAMITRPDPDAGKDENTALERLARLRAAVAGPQPVTAAEVRAAIRRWIGDRLPDHVRALGSPAKMHAWIDDQVTTRVGRPAPVTYHNPGAPGGRWYSASPEGVLTGTGGDDRAETLIRWEEIPAWTQLGITTSVRDRLLSADDTCRKGFRRRLTAGAHPHSGVAAPNGQEDEQSARQLREAIAAAWAAIDAAAAPGPAQLDQARRTYRDTSLVQETLFTGTEPAQQHDDASRTAGQPAAGARPSAQAPPGPGAPPADSTDTPATAEATAVSAPAAPARQQHADAPATAPAAAGGTLRHTQDPPTQAPRPQPGTPLSDDDICLGLRRLTPLVFADLLGVIGTGRPMDPATRQLAPYSGERAAGEVGSEARETVTASPAGVRIQVDAADGTRAGLLSWAEVARWVQPGLTPARRQIIERATRTGLRFAMAHASFRGIGEAALAAGAEQELHSLAVGAVTAMLEDARAARTGQPRPGRQPGHGDGEAAALERIADLATALPARPPQPRTTVWQVKAGDIIGHPGYRLQPFLVSAPPRDRAGQIEITGRLTDPADGEPAGQITLTLTRAGHPDPVVYLVPPPARSLRSLPGGTTTTEGHTDQDHTRADDDSPGAIAQPAARHGQPPATAQRPHAGPAGTPATGSTATPGMTPGTATPGPSRVNGTGQPPGTAPLIQEDTMPSAISGPSLPPQGTTPADRPAPASAAWKLVARPAPASQARPDSQSADDTRLLHELDHVLAAITERRRAAAAPPGTDGTSFADIRAAFTVLRHALDLSGPASNGDGARQAAAVPNAAQHASPPPGAAPDGAAAAHGDFSDIRAAFASLRDVLGLPAPGGHARPADPRPDAPAGPDAGRLLDQAAAEAHACARWYRDTPEWQRMSRIGRAARELLTAIREAAEDYWAEIRLDIRVRGFARTLAARVSLAVSGASHLLAGRLEHAGHRNTRAWRAAWRLHQATATFANRVMNYTPPGSPARMDDARRIIDDLGHGARRPGGPEPSRAASPPGRDTRTPGAVALGRECFPVLVSRANTRPGAAPAARTSAPPQPRQAPAAARR